MGVLDEFRAAFGEDALNPTVGTPEARQNWCTVCACGHLRRHHSTTVGGVWELQPPHEMTVGGRPLRVIQEFHGCRGAMVDKGASTVTEVTDTTADPATRTETFLATCACDEFREIARIDRPNRYFCQRIPADRTDPLKHPFATGIRAFSTFLTGRKAADPERGGDPAWADEEFDRRFEWTARRCALSKCTATDDVWPVFINDTTSELRCTAHRP